MLTVKRQPNFSTKFSESLGFTIIELMVGMTVGLMVLGTLGAVFSPSLITYRNTQALSDIQEGERYALDVLSRNITQAGYAGCDSRAPAEIINVTSVPQSDVAWASTLTVPVQITPATTDAAIFLGGATGTNEDFGKNKRITDGSGGQLIGDVISIVSTVSGVAPVLLSHDPAAEEFIFRGDQVANLSKKFILLNDCNRSTFLRLGEIQESDYDPVDGIYGSTVVSYAADDTDDINCEAEDGLGANLGIVYLGGSSAADCNGNESLYQEYEFSPGTHASTVSSTSFYLAESSLAGNVPSLYSVSLNDSGNAMGSLDEPPIELIAGVENLRARYGVLGSTGDIQYLTASNFSGSGQDIDGDGSEETFRNIVSVEVSLMLRSSVARNDRSSSDKQELSFIDSNGDSQDCSTAADTLINNSACPKFINKTVREKGRYRRVVKKLFNIRNITL